VDIQHKPRMGKTPDLTVFTAEKLAPCHC